MPEKYDLIGTGYNQTRKADKFLALQLLHFLNPQKEGLYLDIGCGTGNYTHEFHKKGFNFIGIDPSVEMLEKAKSNKSGIDWRIGRAEETSLKDNSVDGLIASLTIHHWMDLKAGFKELSRVLKPDGNLVIFTATPTQMKGYWLNHYFPKMLEDSMVQMPSYQKIESAMKEAGLSIVLTEPYFIQPNLEDLFLYSGKHNPNLYFNPEVRNGISSFSSLANAGEVKMGLKKLKGDISSGKIDEVVSSYQNDMGDYLFIKAKKITEST